MSINTEKKAGSEGVTGAVCQGDENDVADVPIKPSGESLPYKVWSLDPLYYQYSWEESWCEGRFATLDEAVRCARRVTREGAQVFAESASSPEAAFEESSMLQNDVWIDGPGVSNSKCEKTGRLVFDRKTVIRATIGV